MRHLRLYVTVIIFSCFSAAVFGQQESRLRISLLTCTPGDELYSIFGHSAIRVIDSNSVTDVVYNYGTFNFNDEGFYLKFVRGKLLYYVSLEEFRDFLYMYQYENRGITEQVLDLSELEKQQLRTYLNENLKEENRYYQYDFFFDNCTTRLRDLISRFKSPPPVCRPVMPPGTRFRQAIHQYLDRGGQYWSKLGIDILLGMPTDGVMSASDQQFLPDNLMWSLDSVVNTKVVQQKNELFRPSAKESTGFRFTPGIFFITLLVIVVGLSMINNKAAESFLTRLDGLLFFLTGCLGLILLFMWFGTDHSMTKNNLNLLWAWPTHAIAAFFTGRRSGLMKKYWLVSAAGSVCTLASWYFLPQQLNQSLIPFVLILLYRAVVRYLKN